MEYLGALGRCFALRLEGRLRTIVNLRSLEQRPKIAPRPKAIRFKSDGKLMIFDHLANMHWMEQVS
jgi:hypothetical protein